MAAKYKALTYIMLGDERKSPGDPVTVAELEEAGQTQDNIDQLFANGALGYEEDEVHKDHLPVDAPEGISDGDGGGGSE